MVDLDGDRIRTPRERSSQSDATLGEVREVFTRSTTDDSGDDAFSNHEARVLFVSQQHEPRRIPIHQDFPGTAGVPKVGDQVRVEYLHGRTDSPIITGYAYTRANRPPLAREGHWRREFNDLYIEAERSDHNAIDPGTDDYDVIRLAKKSDGLSNPTTQVAIDDSGSTTQVKIETDGDITISAGGDVVIDEGGSTKSVLTEDAVFQYEQRVDTSDGSGGTTTQTTTTVSNGETTQTQIE